MSSTAHHHSKRIPFSAVPLLLVALATGVLPAQEGPDRVVLTGGSEVRGTVTRLKPDPLVLELASGVPPLELAWAQVRDLETAGTLALDLEGGQRLLGRVLRLEDGRLVVAAPPFGELSVSLDKLVQGFPEDQAPPALPGEEGAPIVLQDLKSEKELEKALDRLHAKLGREPYLKRKGWTGKIRLAGSFQTGNVDANHVDFRAEATRTWERDRLSAGARVRYGRSEGETTASFGLVESKFDHYFEKNFYGYASMEVSRDKIQNLDLRALFGVGVGLMVWEGEKEHQDLSFEGGLSALYEDFEGEDSELEPALRLAAKYRDVYFENLHFVQEVELLTPVTDPKDFLFRSRTSTIYPLGESWNADNTLEVTYQNEPPAETEELDIVLTVGIEHTF